MKNFWQKCKDAWQRKGEFWPRCKAAFEAIRKDSSLIPLVLGFVLIIVLVISMVRFDFISWSWILSAIGVLGLLLALCVFFNFFMKGLIFRFVGWVLAFSLCLLSFYQISAMDFSKEQVNKMCAPLKQSDGIARLYTSKDTPIDELDQLNNKKIAMLSSRNEQMNEQVTILLKNQGIVIEPMYYDSLQYVLLALKKQLVSAILINDYDYEMIRSIESDQEFLRELVMIDDFRFERPSVLANTSINIEKTPFTVLTRVYSSSEDDRLYDLALMVINPIIKNVYVALIPRDYLVSVPCKEGSACSITNDKLSLVDYLGVDQTINTVEYLLGVPVDFVMDLHLNELLNIAGLETLQLENNLETTFKDNYFAAGTIEMKAEKAKIYAQVLNDTDMLDRYSLHNPFEVLEAFLKLEPITNYDEFAAQLESLGMGLQSSFTYDQLSWLIRTFFLDGQVYSYEIDELQGNDGFVYSPMLTAFSYVITPNQISLNNVAKKISLKLEQSDAGLVSQDEPYNIITYDLPQSEEVIPEQFYEDVLGENSEVTDQPSDVQESYDYSFNDAYNYGYDYGYDDTYQQDYGGYEGSAGDEFYYEEDFGYEDGSGDEFFFEDEYFGDDFFGDEFYGDEGWYDEGY